MPLQSATFQTQATDDILKGQVMAMDVLDPPGSHGGSSLLEADDEFYVQLSWQLTGAGTTTVGGSWIVSLYSSDLDGVGPMRGLIAGPATIPVVSGIAPLNFQHTFTVAPLTLEAGLYMLFAAINHSLTGDPAQLSEMFGYAQAIPIKIVNTAEANGG